jgi:excisionase family DNA binding protein
MDKVRSFDELPVTLRVENLTTILDIGRNTAYELVRSGQIRSVRVGRQIRIPKDEVVRFLAVISGETAKER